MYRFPILLFLFFAITSCKTHYTLHHTKVSSVALDNIHEPMADTSDVNFMLPYKNQVDAIMEKIIGESETALEKNSPEGLLGNFATDACMQTLANQLKDEKIDFCFLNNGGLRTPMPKGKWKMGNVFELMPFENELVLVYVNGKAVIELCDFIAAKGGMPVSGISMEIKAGKAQNILIKNLPIENEKKYCILTSDFLANGGDKLTMLAAAEKKVPGIKVRDAILSYIESQTTIGKTISVKLEGRITNAK